ncbi:pyrroline-5-carboxylate reductase [Heliorestis convoluta]|uniref:Pyrroline-5-carboxylate reductase n=1 Tax=Heliorestis convoluta TaxID=356322 RepID=A0A5Q2MZ45_9FIRM|nr:pyrroline-5-carboxylate reductase [Heliorestis convoluta]QGG47947.1 pyrroline-5-carboxylate reductase [Heliorestis convoluta]
MGQQFLQNRKIGFIGGGAMAEALLRGLSNLFTPDRLAVSDLSEQRLKYLKEELSVNIYIDNNLLCRDCTILLLAIKPQVLPQVLTSLKGKIGRDHLVISVAAGISLQKLESLLPEGVPAIRVMPNTPSLIGKGVSALSRGTHVSDEQIEAAMTLMGAVGTVELVPEAYMDAVTGVSGSGPAYVYLFIEAFIDAAVREGLPRDLARNLALHTVIGAAEMVLQSGNHPAVEKDKVTSPGGTTIAALEALEEKGLRSALFAAVNAAAQRARQLATSE